MPRTRRIRTAELDALDAQQRAAVTTTDRPVCIVAPAGTGKTHVLVLRTLYLLSQGVDPSQIMLVTFSRKAADTLLDRLVRGLRAWGLRHINLDKMYVGTIHGMCLRIIKEQNLQAVPAGTSGPGKPAARAGDPASSATVSSGDPQVAAAAPVLPGSSMGTFRIADSFDQQYLVFLNWKRFEALPDWKHFPFGSRGRQQPWLSYARVVELAGFVTEELADINRMLRDPRPHIRAVAQATRTYHELLAGQRWMDFSSIQTEAYHLLQRPEILGRIQQQIRHIMVDEYQDTNAIQEQILMRIAGQDGCMCVAGDPSQAIYRFRGATVRNILSFTQNPQWQGRARTIVLDTQHRSEQQIPELSRAWMAQSKEPGLLARIAPQRVKGAPLHEAPPQQQARSNGAPPQQQVKSASARAVWRVLGGPVQTGADPGTLRPSKERDSGSAGRGASDANNAAAQKEPSVTSPEAWADRLADLIVQLKDRGYIQDYSEVALISRSVRRTGSGFHISCLMDALEKRAVPVYAPRAALFFQRQEVRLALGLLLLAFPAFSGQLERIATQDNAHRRAYLAYLQTDCLDAATRLLKKRPRSKMTLWVRAMRAGKGSWEHVSFLSVFQQMLAFEPFRRALRRPLSADWQELRAAHNLALLASLISTFEYFYQVEPLKPDTVFEQMHTLFDRYFYYRWLTGVNEPDPQNGVPKGCVQVLTIHQAKGSSYPVVITDSTGAAPAGANPLQQEIRVSYGIQQDIEPASSTARLDFYRAYNVAFTRAQKLLVLTGAYGADEYFKQLYAMLEDLTPEAVVRLASADAQATSVVAASRPGASASRTDIPTNRSTTRAGNIANATSAANATTLPVLTLQGDIAQFRQCPLRYKFYRALGFPQTTSQDMLFNRLLEQTLADVHASALAGRGSSITARNVRLWLDANYDSLRSSQRIYLDQEQLDRVHAQIMKYVAWRESDWSGICATQVELGQAEPGYILRGSADLLTLQDGELGLFAIRPGEVPAQDSPRWRSCEQEMRLCAYLLAKQGGQTIKTVQIYFMGSQDAHPVLSFELGWGTSAGVLRSVDRIASAIVHKDFEHKTSDLSVCVSCAFTVFCRRDTGRASERPGIVVALHTGPGPSATRN